MASDLRKEAMEACATDLDEIVELLHLDNEKMPVLTEWYRRMMLLAWWKGANFGVSQTTKSTVQEIRRALVDKLEREGNA